MRDKRSVDELSIDELERILAIRKRAVRQERLRRYEAQGRRLPTVAPLDAQPVSDPLPDPQQHEAAKDLPPVEPPVTYDLTDDVPRFEDEIEQEAIRRRRERQPRQSDTLRDAETGPRRRTAFDRLLLAVEVAGVIGIVIVLVVGGYLLVIENDRIDELEQKSADIQREAEASRPTPSPAPELRVTLSEHVLPGGHYSPDQTGGIGAFNLDELPESVRPAVMAQLTAPQATVAPPQPVSPVRIEIPRIGVDASIYGGDDWFSLQKGVGHLVGSANPGERGNMVLSAHNDIYGEIFKEIQRLEPGDEIYVTANNGRRYTYVVRDKQIVKPTDTWVLASGSEAIVTLITCHPYRVDSHRMVVFAELREGEQS
ncbi:MAG: sortase [Anaerolineae bacterium]|jgi:sortase A|nr:sortase [Anaerolineae bacterium]